MSKSEPNEQSNPSVASEAGVGTRTVLVPTVPHSPSRWRNMYAEDVRRTASIRGALTPEISQPGELSPGAESEDRIQ